MSKTLIQTLKTEPHVRMTYGCRWLVYDKENGKFVVYQKDINAKKIEKLCAIENEAAAAEMLIYGCMQHKNAVRIYDEADGKMYYCPDCNCLLDEDGNIIRNRTKEIPF